MRKEVVTFKRDKKTGVLYAYENGKKIEEVSTMFNVMNNKKK